MSNLVVWFLMAPTWDPPPSVIAPALASAPDGVVQAHGYVAGLLATRSGQRPAMGFIFCIPSSGYRGREPWRAGWYLGIEHGLARWRPAGQARDSS